jgi:nicotinate-nucleotide adenylyltransferase
MGEDSLRDLPTWHDPERILRVAEIGVAGRPGVEADLNAVSRAVPGSQGRVHLAPTDEVQISSSDIRQRVSENRPIQGLVPPGVEAYIHGHGLYKRHDVCALKRDVR